MDKTYTPDLPSKDLFSARDTTIQSMNQIVYLIKENKERVYSKVFYVFSLIFAVLIAIFAQSLNLLMVLVFVDLLLVLLIFFAKRFYKRSRGGYSKRQPHTRDNAY